MSYSLTIAEGLDRKFTKLFKKNKKQYEMIFKKADEIIINPQHYKNLRSPLQHLKEVHIDSHFVLVFSVDENLKIVKLVNFVHHDEIF